SNSRAYSGRARRTRHDVRFGSKADIEARQKTYALHKAMSALPPKADMCGANSNVRFGPKADLRAIRATQQHEVLRSARRQASAHNPRQLRTGCSGTSVAIPRHGPQPPSPLRAAQAWQAALLAPCGKY